MTREEARDQIVIFMCDEQKVINDRDKQALEMAIQALEQSSGDLISRQEAIKAIDEKAKRIKNEDTLNGLAGAVGILFDLPSVTQKSETVTEFADRCRECGAKYGKLLKQEICEDAISRQAVLSMQYRIDDSATLSTRDVVNVDDIEDLPSVNTQKWIPISERFPEDKTYVLTTIKVPNRIAHARSSWYEGGFFYNDNGDRWRATDMEVKAWMPLPKPYDPQERSEE